MNIAMVSEHASPLAALGGVDAGGQNVHVAALATCIGSSRQGHTVTVYTRRDALHLDQCVHIAPGVSVRHLAAGPAEPIVKDELLGHMDELAAGLSAAWTNDRPDVVHAHFWMSALASLRAARPLGIPVVVTFHALGAEKRRHQKGADTSPACRIDVERRIAQSADLVIATSRAEVDELDRLGAEGARIAVIPCGVDVDQFRPEGYVAPRSSGLRRIVVIGRLVERKGIEDVITALGGAPDAELIIAGGMPPERLDADVDAVRLRSWSELAGVADRTHLVGRVDHESLPSLIRSADVVVCAPWYEPFGMVALEAMACGVPVVATAVGGLLDSVQDGKTGLHVPPKNPAAIADALRLILDDPLLARRLGETGVRRVRSRFSWQSVAHSTLSAYEVLLHSSALADLVGPHGLEVPHETV